MVGVILLFCLVCGLYMCAKSIMRGAERIRSQFGAKAGVGPTVQEEGACKMDAMATNNIHLWNQQCIDDLKRLFALYQSGALTKEEFEQVKSHLLFKLKAYP